MSAIIFCLNSRLVCTTLRCERVVNSGLRGGDRESKD